MGPGGGTHLALGTSGSIAASISQVAIVPTARDRWLGNLELVSAWAGLTLLSGGLILRLPLASEGPEPLDAPSPIHLSNAQFIHNILNPGTRSTVIGEMGREPQMVSSLDCSICTACGTQFLDANGTHPKSCKICDVRKPILLVKASAHSDALNLYTCIVSVS